MNNMYVHNHTSTISKFQYKLNNQSSVYIVQRHVFLCSSTLTRYGKMFQKKQPNTDSLGQITNSPNQTVLTHFPAFWCGTKRFKVPTFLFTTFFWGAEKKSVNRWAPKRRIDKIFGELQGQIMTFSGSEKRLGRLVDFSSLLRQGGIFGSGEKKHTSRDSKLKHGGWVETQNA